MNYMRQECFRFRYTRPKCFRFHYTIQECLKFHYRRQECFRFSSIICQGSTNNHLGGAWCGFSRTIIFFRRASTRTFFFGGPLDGIFYFRRPSEQIFFSFCTTPPQMVNGRPLTRPAGIISPPCTVGGDKSHIFTLHISDMMDVIVLTLFVCLCCLSV